MHKLILVLLFSSYILNLGNAQNIKDIGKITLKIELTNVTNIRDIVGDYVSSYYILNGNEDKIYNINEEVYHTIKKGGDLTITSISCDCNEKSVDFRSISDVISFEDFNNKDTYPYCTKIKLRETHGKIEKSNSNI